MKARKNIGGTRGVSKVHCNSTLKQRTFFFLFATIWQRRTSLWSIGKCEKRVIIGFRFNQSFRNENDASVPRNKILDVTFPQRFKFSQKASLLFLQTNCFFFSARGVRNRWIFPSNHSKYLKWLQKALFKLCCKLFLGLFLKISRWKVWRNQSTNE